MKLEQYIDGLKVKNEQAFEIVYHLTKQAVYAVIISIVRDQSLAEDVMQDTYIKMIQAIHSYQKGRSFKAWLLTIARNQALDVYRKRKRIDLVDITESEHLFVTQANDYDQEDQAERLLSVLEADEKEIVLLHAVENMKHKEIAEVVDKPLGTVLWIYQKALKKMQIAFKKEGR